MNVVSLGFNIFLESNLIPSEHQLADTKLYKEVDSKRKLV